MAVISSIVRIGLAVAIINAAARTGFAYWSFYQFKDAAQQTVVFGGQAPTNVLLNTIMERANELFIPLTPDQVHIQRSGPRTVVEASYVQPIEFFPNQMYPMKFSFAVEGFYMGKLDVR